MINIIIYLIILCYRLHNILSILYYRSLYIKTAISIYIWIATYMYQMIIIFYKALS